MMNPYAAHRNPDMPTRPKRRRFEGWENRSDRNMSLQREMEVYLETGYAESEEPEDLLPWWKNRQSAFPKLARLARSLLCIPATSASSERNFSRSGLIVTDKRSSIAPQAVNDLIIHNFYLVGIILFTLHSKYRHPL